MIKVISVTTSALSRANTISRRQSNAPRKEVIILNKEDGKLGFQMAGGVDSKQRVSMQRGVFVRKVEMLEVYVSDYQGVSRRCGGP